MKSAKMPVVAFLIAGIIAGQATASVHANEAPSGESAAAALAGTYSLAGGSVSCPKVLKISSRVLPQKAALDKHSADPVPPALLQLMKTEGGSLARWHYIDLPTLQATIQESDGIERGTDLVLADFDSGELVERGDGMIKTERFSSKMIASNGGDFGFNSTSLHKIADASFFSFGSDWNKVSTQTWFRHSKDALQYYSRSYFSSNSKTCLSDGSHPHGMAFEGDTDYACKDEISEMNCLYRQ